MRTGAGLVGIEAPDTHGRDLVAAAAQDLDAVAVEREHLAGLGDELRLVHDKPGNGGCLLFRQIPIHVPVEIADRYGAVDVDGAVGLRADVQLGGVVRLTSPGLVVESVQGRWRVGGRAVVELDAVSSRLAPIDPLGSYRLTIAGDAANPGVSQLTLTTQSGALQLSGSGTWGPAGVRFRGDAGAAPGNEAALNNMLNIIGRRSGARSVISIG